MVLGRVERFGLVSHGGRVLDEPPSSLQERVGAVMAWLLDQIVAFLPYLVFVVPMFFWSGCPCCDPPTCAILSDDFNRADSTNIGSNWTETSGDWSINANKLKCNGAGRVTATATAPDANIACSVTVTIGSIATVQLHVANCYIEVQNLAGFSFIRLFREHATISGGFVNIDDIVVTAITSGLMTLCVKDDGALCGSYADHTVGGEFSGVSGTSFGLQTSSATPTFDDFVAQRVDDDCESCDPCPNAPNVCAGCDPEFYAATSATLTFIDQPGTGCCGLATTIVVPATSVCEGEMGLTSNGICSGGHLVRWRISGNSSSTLFTVELFLGPDETCTTRRVEWRYTFDPALESCAGTKTLAVASQSVGACAVCPDMTGSTVEMTLNI